LHVDAGLGRKSKPSNKGQQKKSPDRIHWFYSFHCKGLNTERLIIGKKKSAVNLEVNPLQDIFPKSKPSHNVCDLA